MMSTQNEQTDLAIWRSTSGVVSAWENRCPHRGMRLSHGFVRGESLACAYHGWHYNCSGSCHYIPAHPELEPPASIKPTIYSVVESSGILWVDLKTDATPFDIPDNLNCLRSITLDCNTQSAVQAFSDSPTHHAFALGVTASDFNASSKTLSLNVADGSTSIAILFQQPDSHCVVSHVLADKACTTDALINLSRWCESVRRNAES